MAETHMDPRSRLDESESDDEEQEKGADILEVHNEWEKRGREIPQSETPGVDRAYVALDQNSGIEVVWHEVDLKFRKTQTDLERQKITNDIKTITKMFANLINLDHPNIVNFKDYWINYRERNASDSNQNTWNSNKFSKDELNNISSGGETAAEPLTTDASQKTAASDSQNNNNNQNTQNSQTSNFTNSQYSSDHPKWEVLIPKGDEEFGKTLDSILVEYNEQGEHVAYKDVIFRLVFITEYMNHGSLSDFLLSCQTKSKKTSSTKEKGIQLWCSQVLGAIAYLHSYSPPIIHANLSCETIFRHHNGQLKIGSIALDIIRKHVNNRRPSDTHKSIPPPADEQHRGAQLSPEPGIDITNNIIEKNNNNDEQQLIIPENLDSEESSKKGTSSKVTSPDIAGVPTFTSESVTLASNSSSAATLLPSVSSNDIVLDQTNQIYPEIMQESSIYPSQETNTSPLFKRCEALDLYNFGICALCMLKPTLLKDEKKLQAMKLDSEKAKDYFHKVAKSRRVSKIMDRFIYKCLNAFNQKTPLKASDLLKDKALFAIRPLKLMAAQVLIETNEIAGDEINDGLVTPTDDYDFASSTGLKKEWKWKEVMDLILDLETKKHMKQEEDRLRKIEKRENDKRHGGDPKEKLKPEDAKRFEEQKTNPKANPKPAQKTKAKDPRNLARIKLEDFNLHKYMEDVRQGHHGIHRVNPRNTERRDIPNNDHHYNDETNSMISEITRNPNQDGNEVGDSMTQSIHENIIGNLKGRNDHDDYAAEESKIDKDHILHKLEDSNSDNIVKDGIRHDKDAKKDEKKITYPMEKRPIELCQITFKTRVDEGKFDVSSVISETGTLGPLENSDKGDNNNNNNSPENETAHKNTQRRNSTPESQLQNHNQHNQANNQVQTAVAAQPESNTNQMSNNNTTTTLSNNPTNNNNNNLSSNTQQQSNSSSNSLTYEVEIRITFRGGFQRKLNTNVGKPEKGIEIARELVQLGFISHNDTKQLSTIYNHAWQKAFGEIDNGIGSTDVKDLIKENYLKMQRDQEKENREIEKRIAERHATKAGVTAK